MAFFKVEFSPSGGKTRVNGKSLYLVEADDVATARGMVDAQLEADSSWADVTPVDVASLSSSDMEGFLYRIRISGESAGDPDLIDVEYTGVASDDIDDVGSGLEAALITAYTSEMSAAISDDGGVFTNQTSEANDAATGDVTLLPSSAAQDDAYYYGSFRQFIRLNIDISQVGTGTYLLTWEYWDGTGWSSLAGIVDNTSAYKAGTGVRTLTFNRPADWETTTIGGLGPFFFVRAVVDNGSVTQQPLASQITTQFSAPGYTAGSNTLTVTNGSSFYGNRGLKVECFPPGSVVPVPELIGTIRDNGETVVLDVVLDEQMVIPKVLAEA